MFAFWAAVPKGTKSCRTQRDFFLPVCSFVSPPRPSQVWNLPSQAWNLPSQAWNLPSRSLNLPSQALNLPSQARNLPSQAWSLESAKAWEGWFQACKGRFQPERADFRPERVLGDWWTDGRTNGWTDGWANKSPPVFYGTLSPLGPLPCFLSFQFTTMQSRATGIADQILPLGDLFSLP